MKGVNLVPWEKGGIHAGPEILRVVEDVGKHLLSIRPVHESLLGEFRALRDAWSLLPSLLPSLPPSLTSPLGQGPGQPAPLQRLQDLRQLPQGLWPVPLCQELPRRGPVLGVTEKLTLRQGHGAIRGLLLSWILPQNCVSNKSFFQAKFLNKLSLPDQLNSVHTQICRYPLLLNSYIKYLPKDSPEFFAAKGTHFIPSTQGTGAR